MNNKKAFHGCPIFDGLKRHQNCALLIDGERIAGIVTEAKIPSDYQKNLLTDGLICAGFVDLQVNGGGGVLFNDAPTAKSMQTICDAHLPFGTTALLPTLITDSSEQSVAAITAAREATQSRNCTVLGLHLEGPHLSITRKGTHDQDLIRSMQSQDIQVLCDGAKDLTTLLITLAPESVSNAQITQLLSAGIIISLGHTDASFIDVKAAVEHGASCVTHLFNAMSPLTSREPGVVGATLELGNLHAGLIADGFHVDPVSIKIALRAKKGPGKIFLVTDAMSTVGSDLRQITLNGRIIKRSGGRLTLEDGTLAGADLNMISAVRFMVETIGLEPDEAIRMASLYPAEVIGRQDEVGQLKNSCRADFLHLSSDLQIKSVWQAGLKRF